MTPDQALKETTSLVEAAQKAVGGEWEHDGTGAQSCKLPSGKTGASFALTRLGPGVPDSQRQDVIEKVKKTWSDAGFVPTVSDLPVLQGVHGKQVRYPASGRSDDGMLLEFWIASSATTLDARSRCVVGNPGTLNTD